MKLRKSRTVQKGRIEIIPMIDVMFFFAGDVYAGFPINAELGFLASEST